MKASAFERFEKAATDGHWYSLLDGAIKILIHPAGALYQQAIQDATLSARVAIGGKLDSENIAKITSRAVARVLVKDWKLADDDTPCNEQTVFDACMQYPELRLRIVQIAEGLSRRLSGIEEDDTGNSATS